MSAPAKSFIREIPRVAIQTLFLGLFHFLMDGEKGLYPVLPLLPLAALALSRIPLLRRLRLPWTIAAGALIPWLIRPIIGVIITLLTGFPGANRFFLIEAEGFFLVFVIPFTLMVTANLITGRIPQSAVWEIPAYGLLVMAVARFRDRWEAIMNPQEYFVHAITVILVLILLQWLTAVLARPGYETEPGLRKTRGKALIPLLLFFPILLLLLSLASRISLSAGGGLMQSGLFRFDFSDYLKLESKISMSDDLVLLFRKEGPSEKIYLRRFILSGYSSRKGFFRDEKKDPESRQVTVPRRPLIQPQPEPPLRAREQVKQDYFLVTLSGETLLGMNTPDRIIPYINWPDSSFKGVYTVYSSVSQAEIYDLVFANADSLSSGERAFFTDYGQNEPIRKLAEEVTLHSENYWSRVVTIESWLKDNFLYTLKPGTAPNGNQLEYFLFDSRKGYCSYFAFAMTLMCRSLGIPARVVVGFFVHPDSGVLNFYPVQANQAHAWVEVWFDGYGWIEFDPTSETMAPGENFEFGMAAPEEFLPLIEEVLGNQDLLREMMEEEDRASSFSRWSARFRTLFREGIRLWFILPLLWVLLLALSRFRFRLLPAKTPSARYKNLYREWLDRLERAGYPLPKHTTLTVWAHKMETKGKIPVTIATKYYLKAVFAPEFTESDLTSGQKALKQLQAGFRALPWYRKWAALVYPLPRFRRIP